MTISATKLRLQVLAMGYGGVLPAVGKVVPLKGWPQLVTDAAFIESFRRSGKYISTALRVENKLAVVDVDCYDAAIVEQYLDRLNELFPIHQTDYLIRYGRKPKAALFMRTTEVFGVIRSRKYLPPGAGPDTKPSHVEIFGGSTPRYFSCFGEHSEGIQYEWVDGADPSNVPFADLPEYDASKFPTAVDIFDEIMTAAGWTVVAEKLTGDGASIVYDITDDSVFDTQENGRQTWAEFEQSALDANGAKYCCSASFFEGPHCQNVTRCTACETHSGAVGVHDFENDQLHLHISAKPTTSDVITAALGEALATLKPNVDLMRDPVAPTPPAKADEGRRTLKPAAEYKDAEEAFTDCLMFIQTEFAYCATAGNGSGGALAIYGGRDYSIKALAEWFSGYDLVVPGRKGGAAKRHNPVRTWLGTDTKLCVGGAYMRPDKPRPLYSTGEVYGLDRAAINTYTPPEHPEGGSPAVFWRFLEHLVPDEEERRWFAEWLAHKVQHPEVPGPAVVMVARNTYGTGRGTLFDILGKLFGQRYVKPLPFDMLTGRSGGARFNDAGASALIMTIDEASGDEESHSVRSRVSAYETLKSIVDPAAEKVRRFEPKGKPAFEQVSYVSYLVATNNPDALKLPDNDRRFSVVRNGAPMDQALAHQVRAWMANPVNIGAAYRALKEAEITVFAPYDAPPPFAGKREMITLSKTDIECAVEDAIEMFPGDILTTTLVVALVGRLISNKPIHWEAIAKRVATDRLHPIGTYETRPMLYGKRERPMAKTAASATAGTAMSTKDLRRELARNAAVAGMSAEEGGE